MNKELISVIVPVHNGQDYLENCIQSIAGQSYKPLEILIINDGSTDQTGKVCEKLQKTYEHVTVFTMEDLGVSVARNYALDRAKGEYVTFVDADDRLCPGTLAYLHERITATNSDLAGCRFASWSTKKDWEQVVQNACGQDSRVCKVPERCYDSRQYLTDSILRDNCRCWSKLYHRRLINKVRFREGLSVGEDMLFLVDILPYLQKAVETEYPGYGYYQNPGGVMQRPFTPSYMDQIRCWEMAQERILQIDAGLRPQTAAKIITSVMLTVGKIALCPARERRPAGPYLAECRRKLKEQMRVSGYTAYLPGGYGLKSKMFCYLPGMYVRLYRGLQRMKR